MYVPVSTLCSSENACSSRLSVHYIFIVNAWLLWANILNVTWRQAVFPGGLPKDVAFLAITVHVWICDQLWCMFGSHSRWPKIKINAYIPYMVIKEEIPHY